MAISRRQFTCGLLGGCAATIVAGCARNPVAGRSVMSGLAPPDAEIGRREHPRLVQAFGGAYEDPRLQRYVDAIGRRLAAQSGTSGGGYTFTVLNSPTVNAFALPGGYVSISRGLLAMASSEAEVASVLAHEIGHVAARHTAERLARAQLAQLAAGVLAVATGSRAAADMATLGAMAYLQNFSRQQELEADTLGMDIMVRAGYDPGAAVAFLRTLEEENRLEARMAGTPGGEVAFNVMSTHPRTVQRVQAAVAQAQRIRPAEAEVDRDAHLGAIDGMVYGDDPAQGLVLGRRFVHPPLRFEFQVPEGFRLINGTDKVVAKHPDDAMVVFDMGPARSRDMRGYIAREWAPNLPLSNIEAMRVDGMDAATATAVVETRAGPAGLRLVAVRRTPGQAFRFMFLVPANAIARFDPAFRRTAFSLRRLSTREAAAIGPMRLDVVTVRPGDSVASLARTMPHGRWNTEMFRVLNDIPDGRGVVPGQVVKVVVPSLNA